MPKAIEYNAKGVEVYVRVLDPSTFLPVTGLTVNTTGSQGVYRRDLEAPVLYPLSDGGLEWYEGRWYEIGDGYYTVGVPDSAWQSGSRGVHNTVQLLPESNFVIATYCPLQRTLQAVSFSTDQGLYAVVQDVYDIFGEQNVKKWANMDSLPETDPNYEAYITARIEKALTYATNDINDKLRGGPYTIPFVEGALAASINLCCVYKTGVTLYEWRGSDDMDMEDGTLVHRYTYMTNRADTILEEIRTAARDLDVAKIGSRTPGIVNQ